MVGCFSRAKREAPSSQELGLARMHLFRERSWWSPVFPHRLVIAVGAGKNLYPIHPPFTEDETETHVQVHIVEAGARTKFLGLLKSMVFQLHLIVCQSE